MQVTADDVGEESAAEAPPPEQTLPKADEVSGVPQGFQGHVETPLQANADGGVGLGNTQAIQNMVQQLPLHCALLGSHIALAPLLGLTELCSEYLFMLTL